MSLHDMHRKVTSVPEHNLMLKSVAPLSDYFGVNNFYYVRVTSSGYYSSLSTHDAWHEYFCENITTVGKSPFLRQPDLTQPGINLLNNTDDPKLKNTLATAWNEYGINFTLNIIRKIPEGIEAFGFGTHFDDPRAEEKHLNELPLLNKFIDYFCEKNRKLIRLTHEYQVEVTSILDKEISETDLSHLNHKKSLIEHLELGAALSLSERELQILRFVANGFPASYIAQQVHLSHRTVEDHLASIKYKLNCRSKPELIRKAQEIVAVLPAATF